MTAENFAAELESLEKRNRKKDIQRRIVEGPKQPWRPTRHGPMREVILTVNKDWFEGDAAFFGEDPGQREEQFGELAKAWLIDSFGNDVIHARADRDEAAYHIHAVIMPRATVEIAKPKAKKPIASATRHMLQPSKHAPIKDYEAAQESVGEWFAPLGLVRGERRANAIREARANGQKPPKRRYHAKTWKWRAEQELRLKKKAEALAVEEAELQARAARVSEREDEAETVLAVAEGIATEQFRACGDETEAALVEAPSADQPPRTSASLDELYRRSPKGFARAAGVFGRAWKRLFGEARTQAEAEAAAGVSDAMEQIAEADSIIADAAQHLPPATRSLVAGIRRTVPALFRRLERSGGTHQKQPDPSKKERSDPEGEESYE
jgi:hypothetical protein